MESRRSVHKNVGEELRKHAIKGIEVVEGYRSGSVIITYENFAYVVNYKRNNVIYLKCRIKNCNGSACITLYESGSGIVNDGNEHLHSSDSEYIHTIKFRSKSREVIKKQIPKQCSSTSFPGSPRFPRVTLEQKKLMVSFMEDYPQLSVISSYDSTSKVNKRALWIQLTDLLNQAGPARPMDKWRKVWRSWRNKVKRKLARILDKNKLFRRKHALSPLEERIVSLKRSPLPKRDGKPLRKVVKKSRPTLQELCDTKTSAEDLESQEELVIAVKSLDGTIDQTPNGYASPNNYVLYAPTNSEDYNGVVGEEIILEMPSQYHPDSPDSKDFFTNRAQVDTTYVNDSHNIIATLATFAESIERMENTMKSMDKSLKDLVDTVKTLVQLQIHNSHS